MNLLVVILIQASFYALLGMGYVLIYRATRVLNLAHGDLMVFGAYLFFQSLAATGGSLTLAIMAAALGAALLGAMVYLGVMRPLASYPVAVGVLATIALGLVLRTIVTVIWSAQTRYPAELLGRTGQPIMLFAGVSISGIDTLIIAAAVIAMVGFPLLLPLAWLLVAGGSYLVARRAWLGAILATAADFVMEPVMVQRLGYWRWLEPGPLPGGAPWLNPIGWFVCTWVAGLILSRRERKSTLDAPVVLGGFLLLVAGLGIIGSR